MALSGNNCGLDRHPVSPGGGGGGSTNAESIVSWLKELKH